MNKAQPPLREVGVCLATTSFYPLYAGPAVRFQRYAPGLKEHGIQMHVFAQSVTPDLEARDGLLDSRERPNIDPLNGRTSELGSFDTVGGVKVKRTSLPNGRTRMPIYFSRLARHCKAYRRETDVVQFLRLNLPAVPWLLRLRRLGIATVFTQTLLGELSQNRWRRALQRIHRRLPLDLVDCIVVSSTVMKRHLEKLGVTSKVHVIPNGVDLERFRPVTNQDEKRHLRSQLGLDPKSDIILAIGPVSPRKGTEILVKAFADFCADYPNAQLVLVGPRHDLGREELRGFHREISVAIANSGASQRVIFTGPVDNVQDYLRAADLLVFPSRREGMPNVVPEAMACGIPIIMTPFIGLPDEFGTPGTHYLLSSWETESLALYIRTLLDSIEQRQNLGRAGLWWAQKNLNVVQSICQYATLYRELSEHSRKPSRRTV